VNDPEQGFLIGGLRGSNGEYIMKNRIIVSLLIVVLLALVMSTGCGHPGKTAAEVNRDHVRMLQINQQQMMYDIDRAMFFDKPHKLSERHMP
jgi:hypothetical protein